MFQLTPDGVYQSSMLRELPGVRHGFPTRTASGWPGSVIRLKQIHSATVHVVDGQSQCSAEGDALLTTDAGKWIGIYTADCVPVLIGDRSGRAVGAVHAGWRGTVGRIAQAAVQRMVDSYGLRADSLVAAVGPCIGECCFEVGPEVSEQFGKPGAKHLDLPGENCRQLIEAGVPAANIDVAGLCTMCDATLFESFRRDREQSGRMLAAIGIFRD